MRWLCLLLLLAGAARGAPAPVHRPPAPDPGRLACPLAGREWRTHWGHGLYLMRFHAGGRYATATEGGHPAGAGRWSYDPRGCVLTLREESGPVYRVRLGVGLLGEEVGRESRATGGVPVWFERLGGDE